MRKRIVIANLKLGLSLKETENLTEEIIKELSQEKKLKNLEIVICPSFPAIPRVYDLIKVSPVPISLGAQNVFWEEKGAYTGEVSVLMLKELEVSYVIIGHSERREYLKESEEMINKKVKVALAHNLIPIVCVGETLEERERSQKEKVISRQINEAFKDIEFNKNNKIIVAYEPVWVIGSGQAITAEEAENTGFFLRGKLTNLFPPDFIEKNIKVIYGGSVDSKNIRDFAKKNIDGFLIGSASLKAVEFCQIIKILSEI